MKKAIVCVISALLVQLSLALTEKVGDYTWEYFIRDGKAQIGTLSENVAAVSPNPIGEIIVPSKLGGYIVERIDSWAFYGCNSMTKVQIPDCILHIGGSVFKNCSALQEVIIPPNVGKIDYSTFAECIALTNVVIPASVGEIGKYAFKGCSGLENIIVPNSVTNIQSCAFSECSGLQCMTLPFIGSKRGNTGTVDSVFGHIFGNTPGDGLVQVRQSLDDGITHLWATNYLSAALRDIRIVDETVVGYGAFFAMDMVTNISINAGISSIGGYAFRNCTGLKRISIPQGVVRLDSAAFRGCGLENVIVPLSVTNIGSLMFEKCISLKKAYIPKRFKGNLYASTFQNCTDDLQVIYYDEDMIYFDEMLTAENSSTSNIVTTCTGNCVVTFMWKCSCEPMIKGVPYDFLSFSIDGEQKELICGETEWMECSYNVVGDKEHTLTWTYQKDSEGEAGEDCGWISQVTILSLPTIKNDLASNVSAYQDGGYVVVPSANIDNIEVLIPDKIDAATVAVKVPVTASVVKLNGANIIIIDNDYDITKYIDIPNADNDGFIELARATVKEEVVKEALDVEKGAEVTIGVEEPVITTAATKPGLTYTFRQGKTLERMQAGDDAQAVTKVGDGEQWSPDITVKDPDSAFYSIEVTK